MSLWLFLLTAGGVALAAYTGIGVLVRSDVTGADLPEAILGFLTFGLGLLLAPLPIVALYAALAGRRRPPPAAPTPLRPAAAVRFTVLAVSLSLALAVVAELVRPWTLAVARALS